VPITTGNVDLGGGYATLAVTQDDFTGDGIQDLQFEVTLNGGQDTPTDATDDGDIRAVYYDLPTLYDGSLSQIRLFATAFTDTNSAGTPLTLNSSLTASPAGIIQAYEAVLNDVNNVGTTGAFNDENATIDPDADGDAQYDKAFDIGAEIGTNGRNPDQIDSLTLLMTLDPDGTGAQVAQAGQDLLLQDFYEELTGIRIQTVSATDPLNPEAGETSLKLIGEIPPPPPPPPGEACFDGLSHGFWKTHQGDWKVAGDSEFANVNSQSVAPTTSYEALFGIDSKWSYVETGTKVKQASDITLAKALALTGGDQNALARDAVGAVLNAVNEQDELIDGDASYRFSAEEIITAVQQVYGIGNSNPDNVYNAALGTELQGILNFWNTVHDEEGYVRDEGYCIDATSPQATASLNDLLFA
jgi:hypothetical protein